ncbi:serine hydrolase domain-containing protein [Dermatobacter hominis]|uniref:serine hydrolase domain-containing protein n=1 Tax=Dermatobacter hominis TaxID=2884263 RepID=UPI001D0F8E56|nr:serine hydrolase domain-containing protein [Dermatobacter hominis]UDY36116.1 beta-lactamase family protein [Dermatobacter hominis]
MATDPELDRRLHDVVQRHIDEDHIGAASWRVQRGDVVVDGSAGALHGGAPARLDTIYRITSMSKPITAAAALTFVGRGEADLDEPVDRHLPELSDMQVLRRPDGPVDDTEPAERPITLRDLMAFTLGWGMDFSADGSTPWDEAAEALGVAFRGPEPDAWPPPDEWIAAMGSLPLLRQPGRAWGYHHGSDVLGVWLERAGGAPLQHVLSDRVLRPLGMVDTGFHVPAGSLERFGACTMPDETGAIVVHDDVDGAWSSPPRFPSGGAGLVSTIGDYTAFAQMLLRGGTAPDGSVVVPEPLVAEMGRDQLTDAQRSASADLIEGTGWGLGCGVCLVDTPVGPAGSTFWDGGFGSIWTNDRAGGTSLVLLTDRIWSSPDLQRYAVDARATVFQGRTG